jgi:hypothetical protein
MFLIFSAMIRSIKTLVMMMSGAFTLFSLTCTDVALFNDSEHVWCYPRAFASDKDMGDTISIKDSSGLVKSANIPAGLPVHLFGFITNPKPRIQLEGRWSFGDGAFAVDTFDTSFIIKHVFADTGLYTAFFTIFEGPGNRLYDSVTITVGAKR